MTRLPWKFPRTRREQICLIYIISRRCNEKLADLTGFVDAPSYGTDCKRIADRHAEPAKRHFRLESPSCNYGIRIITLVGLSVFSSVELMSSRNVSRKRLFDYIETRIIEISCDSHRGSLPGPQLHRSTVNF